MTNFTGAGVDELINNYIGLGLSKRSRTSQKEAIQNLSLEKTSEELLEASGLEGEEGLNKFIEKEQSWKKNGIHLLSYWSATYPELLRSIHEPPLVLFYRGVLPAVWPKTAAAIVGSRNGDLAGCEISERFAQDLSRRGVCVVSGLARGIDGAAHSGALRGGAAPPTIAVLGNGLEKIYPSSNERLASDILDCGGLLFSQFEPGTPPYPSNFLDRNRIIAGLSNFIIVIQAAQRSGALSTARYALEEGRDIMVIPGDIRDKRYEGSNRLIRQGAYLVTTIGDIEDIVPDIRTLSSDPSVKMSCTPREQAILFLLQTTSSMHIDELSRVLGTDLSMEILNLELAEVIRRLPGNFIAINTIG